MVIRSMKQYLLLLIFSGLFFSCKSAKEPLDAVPSPSPTILLIGTSHDLRETPAETIEEVKKEIMQFQPEVFFVEIPPADDKYANELVFNYSRSFTLFQHLLNKKNIHIRMADTVIAENQKLLQEDPDNPMYLGSLLHAYLLKFDVANTLYQSYLLFSEYLQNDSVMAALDKTLFSTDTLDQYQIIITGKEKDELSQLVFPVAKTLGLREIYGFDNRDDEYAYNKARRDNDKELRSYVIEKYGISKNEVAIKNKLDTLLGVKKQKVQNSGRLFEMLNADAYEASRKQEYTRRIELTPTESSRNYLKYWRLRNNKMVSNVMAVLEKTKAKKAVIVIGAGHTWILQEILEERGLNVKRPFK